MASLAAECVLSAAGLGTMRKECPRAVTRQLTAAPAALVKTVGDFSRRRGKAALLLTIPYSRGRKPKIR